MPLFDFLASETRRLTSLAASRIKRARQQAAKDRRLRKVLHVTQVWAAQLPLAGIATPAPAAAKRQAGPASVFDLASYRIQRIALNSAPTGTQRRCVTRDGATVYQAIHYTETPEWIEKERIRRAKQKPPRPPQWLTAKGAK